MPPTIAETTDVEAVDNEDTTNVTPTIVTEAILLDDDALPTLPTVHVENGDDIYQSDTVRLESSHIVSVRDHDPTAACSNDRPEFISTTLQPVASNWDQYVRYLGLYLASKADGTLQLISSTGEGVLFRHSALQTGDVLVNINQTSCHGLSEQAALLALRSAIRSAVTSNRKEITLRWHNKGGNPRRVATTIQKSKPTQSLGLSLARGSGGSINISRIAPHGALSNSLLNPTDRILSINEQIVSASDTPSEVAAWMAAAPVWVNIVAITTTATGVVIATGAGHAGLPTATATPVASETTQSGREARHKKITCIFVGILCFVVLVAGAIVGTSGTTDDDDHYYDPPSPPPADFYGTVTCNQTLAIPINGTPVFGILGGNSKKFRDGPRAPVSYCGTFNQDALYPHGYGQWFTYTIGNLSGNFQVSTCSVDDVDPVDTVLSVFEGKCGVVSSLLECLGFSDDYWEAPACEQRSAVTVYGQAGKEYLAQVQGYNGATGGFGIKVEPVAPIDTSLSSGPCECDRLPPQPVSVARTTAPMPSQSPNLLGLPTLPQPPIAAAPTAFPTL